jgi:flagellar biosynthesis/type III secretory pathway chaperone
MGTHAGASGVRELVETLRCQADLCRRLLALLGAEREAILSARGVRMREIIQAKEALLEEARRLEARRVAALERLAAPAGSPPGEVTLRGLARALGSAAGAPLERARRELEGLLARLRDEHRRNAALCRQGLALAREAHRLLKEAALGDAVYLPSGRLEEARLRGRLVSGAG